MSIGFWSAVVLLGLALIGSGRARHDRFWLISGAVVLALAALAAYEGLVAPRLISGPNGALQTLGILVFAALFATDSFGLPRALAVRLGLGLRNRAWEFDRHLSRERRLLLDAWRSAVEQPHDSRHLAAAKAHLRRIRRLRPPDPAWRAFRDELADLDQRWMNYHLERLPDEPGAVPDYDGFIERWELLREAYRADAAALREESAGALADSMWRLVMATGFGLLGLGMLGIVGGRPPFVLSNPADVGAIIVLGGAAIFLLSIFVPSLRRSLS